MRLLVVVTPDFNLAATMNLVDPFRVANYLDGISMIEWSFASLDGGHCLSSNGLSIDTVPIKSVENSDWDFVVVSASWAPESHYSRILLSALKMWARKGCTLGALDTGAFLLAEAGLLKNRKTTVHYEHLASFRELYPNVVALDELFVFDGNRIACAGGVAAMDFAIQILKSVHGDVLANQTARYLYLENLRPLGSLQQPDTKEPLGGTTPRSIKNAINMMEDHIEEVLSIPEICKKIEISQRQLDRLFSIHVKKTPALYYRDIRLDRARGLVTQTDMKLTEVAVASGFSSQVHFSRSYKERFGLPPQQDRIEGRIPFEYRAKPMHKQKK